jgi:hypothetical protein
MLAACGGPTATPPAPTPTAPAFEPFTDAFVPLVKEAYADAAGVQHRPIEVVIDRATYDDIVALGMDPAEFVDRHVRRMNEILANSGVRIVIDAPTLRYVESMTSDQRGPWNVANSGNWPLTGGFDPTRLGYWNAAETDGLQAAARVGSPSSGCGTTTASTSTRSTPPILSTPAALSSTPDRTA